jgi:hypothetical protein
MIIKNKNECKEEKNVNYYISQHCINTVKYQSQLTHKRTGLFSAHFESSASRPICLGLWQVWPVMVGHVSERRLVS